MSDHLHHLTLSNDPPTSTELALIQHFLSAVGPEPIQDSETAHTVQNYRDFLHPLRRAPSDVIAEIFLYSLQPLGVSSVIVTLDTNKGPWRLGQVCSHWRAVVHSIPAFWSRIHLLRRTRYRSSAPEVLREILNKSGSIPLEVVFEPLCLRGCTQSCACKHLFRQLLKEAPRWESASLTLHPTWKDLPSIHPGPLDVPMLRELRVEMCEPVVDWFSAAPLLSRVSIVGVAFNVLRIPIPRTQIAQFNLRVLQVSLHEHLTILRESSNLELYEVNATLADRHSTSVGSDEQVQLGHLRTLTLTSSSILPHLTLPSLSYLYLPRITFSPYLAQTVEYLIDRSACTLLHLSIGCPITDGDSDAALHMLSEMTHLKSLSVHEIWSYKFFQGLFEGDTSSPTIIPNLEKLSVFIRPRYTYLSTLITVLADALHARANSSQCKHPRTLQLNMGRDTKLNADQTAVLQKLGAEGVTVELNFGGEV